MTDTISKFNYHPISLTLLILDLIRDPDFIFRSCCRGKKHSTPSTPSLFEQCEFLTFSPPLLNHTFCSQDSFSDTIKVFLKVVKHTKVEHLILLARVKSNQSLESTAFAELGNPSEPGSTDDTDKQNSPNLPVESLNLMAAIRVIFIFLTDERRSYYSKTELWNTIQNRDPTNKNSNCIDGFMHGGRINGPAMNNCKNRLPGLLKETLHAGCQELILFKDISDKDSNILLIDTAENLIKQGWTRQLRKIQF